MNVISNYLENTGLGEAIHYGGLTMFPLFGKPGATIEYLTLDEALAAGTVEISEVSDSGSVPELSLKNRADQPVLLLDGEELVGAKQNRVLNLTLLVAPQTTTIIPVTCVEAGRWTWKSDRFRAAGRTQYARGRARKNAQVSESLRARGNRRSDQGAVWADISMKAASMDVDSATGAMADIYERYDTDVRDYVKALGPRPGQTGALFAIGDRIVGCDLFNSTETLQRNLAKLVRGCALDAMERRNVEGVREENAAPAGLAERFLGAVSAATVSRYEAVGLGTELRLGGDSITGAALELDGGLVHLCAFDQTEEYGYRPSPV